MSADITKKKCPICREEAFFAEAEIEGEFPEDRLEIRCQNCGDFHVPSKIVEYTDHSIIIPRLKDSEFDVEEISRTNKYAHAEGKVILWLDSFNEVNRWEAIVEKYSESYGGLRPYEVRVLADYKK